LKNVPVKIGGDLSPFALTRVDQCLELAVATGTRGGPSAGPAELRGDEFDEGRGENFMMDGS
jgi:hypothetical protein